MASSYLNKTVATIAALRSAAPHDAAAVYELKAHSTAGDEGGGAFRWDAASTASDNNGTIIKVSDITTGRWIRQYSRTVNAKWFGAVGDGVADDTTALQAANDAVATGGELYIPAGTYLLNIALYPKSGIKIRGAGRYATVLKRKNSAGGTADQTNVICIQSCINTEICDLAVDGNRANNAFVDHYSSGIQTYRDFSANTHSARCYLHDLWVKECTNNGVALSNCAEVEVVDVISEDNSKDFSHTGFGVVLVEGTYDCKIERCTCWRNYHGGVAFVHKSAQRHTVRNCSLSTVDINNFSTDTNFYSLHTIEGNKVQQISISDGSGISILNNKILPSPDTVGGSVGCWGIYTYPGQTAAGIYKEGWNIAGNHVVWAGEDRYTAASHCGMHLTGLRNFSVAGNVIDGRGGEAEGIRLVGSKAGVVAGNVILGEKETADVRDNRYGIVTEEGAGSRVPTDIAISGNLIRGWYNPFYHAFATDTRMTFVGNDISENATATGAAIVVDSSTDTVYGNNTYPSMVPTNSAASYNPVVFVEAGKTSFYIADQTTHVFVNSGVAMTIYLPSMANPRKARIMIKDVSGVLTYQTKISIYPQGGKTIEGVAPVTAAITVPYGMIELAYEPAVGAWLIV